MLRMAEKQLNDFIINFLSTDQEDMDLQTLQMIFKGFGINKFLYMKGRRKSQEFF